MVDDLVDDVFAFGAGDATLLPMDAPIGDDSCVLVHRRDTRSTPSGLEPTWSRAKHSRRWAVCTSWCPSRRSPE